MVHEFERAFVFDQDDGEQYANSCFGAPINTSVIKDYYLHKGLRIRQLSNEKDQFFITRKTGSKASGCRAENEIPIAEDAAQLLMAEQKLTVHKIRYSYQSIVHRNTTYRISYDKLISPMCIGILEVEADQLIDFYAFSELCGSSLLPCELSIWDLSKRCIGIAGPPSSGKSESAKYLSHTLNTKFKANSFHVVEYATSFIQKYNRAPQFEDQFFIWHGQREREENANCANIVISDCPTFLAYIYAIEAIKELNDHTAMSIAKMYKRVLFDLQRYTDIVFLEAQEYVENGVRYHSANDANRIGSRIQSFLRDHQVAHIVTNCKQIDNLIDKLFCINRLDK